MALIDHTRRLTVTEASQRGVARLVADAEHEELVITRRQVPVAAVVSYTRLSELEDAAADLRDLALVLSRAATDSGRRTSLDDVIAAYGHTRESPVALPDED
ncbi:hypothetical protein AB0I28_21480 [Phytomonospora sp. NPDC050363]|uniref:hypothetical protein n=1 Tax=Phytomonospora sp. NPDC050363 TaxID=3155642 RepID=UPI0033F7562E